MSKNNLLTLLNSIDEFVVPTIQRDYAQGRNNGSNKTLCEEVRLSLIDSLYNALMTDGNLLLDYIYGSQESNVFYPIDGQQRLTTLFLLHWYIGKKENIASSKPNEFNVLRKFSYEIRDTSKEFCQSLIDIDIDFSNELISDQIRDSSKYHNTYNFDPTVLSMLVVLDNIHEKFRSVDLQLWDRLSKIEFWCLPLEKFGLTDDLFVKMNARGKRLTRFDVFKSDLESCLEKIPGKSEALSSLLENWKKEIDNSYLDSFWNRFQYEFAERNLFRTILFFTKAYISTQDPANKLDDSWEIDEANVNYYDVIDAIKGDTTILVKVCTLLSNFDAWIDILKDTPLFLSPAINDPTNIPGYIKAKIFGVLYWFTNSTGMACDSTFRQYERVLDNYIISLRQYNIKPRNYSSSIDNTVSNSAFIGKVFLFIKGLVDGYSDRAVDFNSFIKSTTTPELDYERSKLQSLSFNEIVDIESIPYIKGNTYNVFFNGNLYLNVNQIRTIFSDPEMINKFIRIVVSFSDDEYGKFSKLLMDEITMQSGKKQLYYNDADDKATAYFHKIIFNSAASFGDNILTAKGSGQYSIISNSVQSCVKEISTKINSSGLTESDAIDQLLTERLANADFSDSKNIKWYLVKYREFFHDTISTSLSVLRRKNYTGIDDDNVYDIQCVGINDNDFANEHYHPFYLALCHLLNSTVTIDETTLKYTGVQIEYAHPCELSNGWKIKIEKDGNWLIDLSGIPIMSNNPDFSIDSSGMGHLECSGNDSIRKMADFLNAI